MGFSRQEYWSGLLCPLPWDLPDLGIEPRSPTLQADSLPLSHRASPRITVWSNNSTLEYMRQRIWSRHSNRYLYILFVPFIVTLYTTKRWKQCNSSVHWWMDKQSVYTYIYIHNSASERNEILTPAKTWRNLEDLEIKSLKYCENYQNVT